MKESWCQSMFQLNDSTHSKSKAESWSFWGSIMKILVILAKLKTSVNLDKWSWTLNVFHFISLKDRYSSLSEIFVIINLWVSSVKRIYCPRHFCLPDASVFYNSINTGDEERWRSDHVLSCWILSVCMCEASGRILYTGS